MKKYRIRFNKARGQEGRGTEQHVWRVFEDEKEFLAKDVLINVPSWGEQEGEDWNICCKGVMRFIHNVDIAVISEK